MTEENPETIGINPFTTIFQPNEEEANTITFSIQSESPWIMRLTPKNTIEFNRKDYPNLTENDFAERVVKILETIFVKYPEVK